MSTERSDEARTVPSRSRRRRGDAQCLPLASSAIPLASSFWDINIASPSITWFRPKGGGPPVNSVRGGDYSFLRHWQASRSSSRGQYQCHSDLLVRYPILSSHSQFYCCCCSSLPPPPRPLPFLSSFHPLLFLSLPLLSPQPFKLLSHESFSLSLHYLLYSFPSPSLLNPFPSSLLNPFPHLLSFHLPPPSPSPFLTPSPFPPALASFTFLSSPPPPPSFPTSYSPSPSFPLISPPLPLPSYLLLPLTPPLKYPSLPPPTSFFPLNTPSPPLPPPSSPKYPLLPSTLLRPLRTPPLTPAIPPPPSPAAIPPPHPAPRHPTLTLRPIVRVCRSLTIPKRPSCNLRSAARCFDVPCAAVDRFDVLCAVRKTVQRPFRCRAIPTSLVLFGPFRRPLLSIPDVPCSVMDRSDVPSALDHSDVPTFRRPCAALDHSTSLDFRRPLCCLGPFRRLFSPRPFRRPLPAVDRPTSHSVVPCSAVARPDVPHHGIGHIGTWDHRQRNESATSLCTLPRASR
ncbi:hypothetical protein C7M84_011343 [Penaeus vannamei]|uniref:Uncharacterized protein n=1 Tax=Penaeus vannamei TaxID=6689 RepID=A0A3R7Q7C2_PENVA|nr:hypothetical protein C7M84_011343 [Penaeus vannamei]